jgi:hypothetical protein
MEAHMQPPRLPFALSPARLAQALAITRDPASVACHPALLQDAWCELKAARGQPVRLDRLRPSYLVQTAPAPLDRKSVV